MAAECAGAVMVFAVYVIGDRAADAYEFRAWGHWQKPAARYHDVEYV